jgi:hypothetical protein
VNSTLDRVCCMLSGKSSCERKEFADLLCGLLCGVGERVRMSEGKVDQQEQFTNHPSLTPSTQQHPKTPMHQPEPATTQSAVPSLGSSMTNKCIIYSRLAESKVAQGQKTYLIPDPSLSPPRSPVEMQRERTSHRALADPDSEAFTRWH